MPFGGGNFSFSVGMSFDEDPRSAASRPAPPFVQVPICSGADQTVAVETLIMGAINHTHPSCTNLFEDSVMPERLANHGAAGRRHPRIISCLSRIVNSTEEERVFPCEAGGCEILARPGGRL